MSDENGTNNDYGEVVIKKTGLIDWKVIIENEQNGGKNR